jgi:hypothetical protein
MINLLYYIILFLLLYLIIFPTMICYFLEEKISVNKLKKLYYLIFKGDIE